MTEKHTYGRALLVHLNPLSARLHFYVAPNGDSESVILPQALPALASFQKASPEDVAIPHPAALPGQIAEQLGIDASLLHIEAATLGWAEIPGGWVNITLLRAMTTDLPEIKEGRFIGLMDLLAVPVPERLIMRAAYEVLLGD